MKVLYLGGVYHVEYALYQEHLKNDGIDLLFAGNNSGFYPVRNWFNTDVLEEVQLLKKIWKPDLTILRTWAGVDHLVDLADLVWAQEAHPIMDDGSVEADESEQRIPGGYNPAVRRVAYTSPHKAQATNQHWLPYCVSDYWGDLNVPRDIPIMVATNLPERGHQLKVRSLDILVKPLITQYPALVHVFSGRHTQSYRKYVPYMLQCVKPSYIETDTNQILSRAQIYLSPTTIWHNEGFVSYKIYEAMNCGCTVVTNKYPGMEYMMGLDGDTIIYANSAEETLNKVTYLLNNPAECTAIGQRARTFVRKKYGVKQHLMRVYNEIKNDIPKETLN